MNDNQTYLANLCEKICSQGLKPSLALIRGQSTRALPIPEIIKFLQRWKQDPSQFDRIKGDEEPLNPQNPEISLDARVAILEQQVTQLAKQLASLLKQSGISDKEA